jgi:trehalose 6-phosphate synthase
LGRPRRARRDLPDLRQPEVVAKAASLRADETGRRIVLGVDRLDYTKGILQKLEAFRRLLETSPELRGNVTLVQIAVPSREEIPGYREHRTAIERLVGEINGTFTRSGWVPVHYLHRPLEGPRLSAYYLAADVGLVTPLKDGMNLVAKEYCATRVSKDGVLVLSEFAGAAAELQRAALLVNPYDVEGVADTLRRALDMPRAEQRARMSRLRRTIRERDIYHWLDAFLRAAISRDLAEFPRVADYLPTAIAS